MALATEAVANPRRNIIDFPRQSLHWRPAVQPEKNRLLASLPAADYQRLAPHFETVRLQARQMLASPEQPMRYVYFPRDAMVTFLVPMEDGSAAEGATVGNEGMIGLQVFLGDGLASEEIVPVILGEAVRVPTNVFKDVVQHSQAFQTALHRYIQALMHQMARTAGCNRVHTVDQRCARLLLMSSDGVGQRTFSVTHEFLATMLAVRRASVTEAAGALQQAGLIAYHRGQMTIRNRQALEAVACEDYRLTRDTYDRLYASRLN
jgi:CRP-like cAMP-binding protein